MRKITLLLFVMAGALVAQVYNPYPGKLVPNSGGSSSGTVAGTTGKVACFDSASSVGDCADTSYTATGLSGTTWTVNNATHGLGTNCSGFRAKPMKVTSSDYDDEVPLSTNCNGGTWTVMWSASVSGELLIYSGTSGGGGGGGGGAPTDAPYWLSTSNGTLSAEVNLGALADNSVVAVDVATGTATPRAALYSDITPLWDSGACGTDYLRGNGTCDTPSGSLPALGTAYQMLRVNSGASASEWATLGAGAGVSVTPSAGTTTISVDSTQVPLLALDNAFLGDNSFAGITTYTPSSAQTLVAGDAVTVTASTVKRISTAGAVTSTATPTIADGNDGQMVYIHNSGANDWTMQDESGLAGSNLCLPSGTSVTLNPGDTVAMVFISASSCWSKLK